MRIDHGPPDVTVKRAEILDPAPGKISLGQGGLEQVLGIGPVAVSR